MLTDEQIANNEAIMERAARETAARWRDRGMNLPDDFWKTVLEWDRRELELFDSGAENAANLYMRPPDTPKRYPNGYMDEWLFGNLDLFPATAIELHRELVLKYPGARRKHLTVVLRKLNWPHEKKSRGKRVYHLFLPWEEKEA